MPSAATTPAAIIPIDSLTASPKTGVIESLRCGNDIIRFTGGGCEFGDWYGFFSHERLGGNRVTINKCEVNSAQDRANGTIVVALPCGEYEFRFDDRLDAGTLRRTYHLKSVGVGAMGDMVIRSAVRAADFQRGDIAGRAPAHVGLNRFMQHETSSARLIGNGIELAFDADVPDAPGRLGMYTYLRDQPDGQWIMHHRLLTECAASDEYVLRVRHAAYSSKSSFWVKSLRGVLWRACEKHPWIRPTIQVGGNIIMKPGETWTMSSTIRVVRRETRGATATP
ncbi:MAG: hypothetical protein ACKVS9_05230 [Phycisphaerae bacterium]